MKNPIITLLTDFGTQDHYVASIKGVILRVNPRCTIVDISHEVKPQDILEGAFILVNTFRYFPKNTIFLCVVDPEVGGSRKPILIVTGHYFFVGPDNGLLSIAAREDGIKEIIVLNDSRFFMAEVSPTFHGRDIFAPAASHLSLGIRPKTFGTRIDSLKEIDLKKPGIKRETMSGEVLHIDRFGNLITNIAEKELHHFLRGRPFQIQAGNEKVGDLKKGYWEGRKGDLITLMGSGGFFEIAVKDGSAEKRLKAKKGDPVIIRVRGGKQ